MVFYMILDEYEEGDLLKWTTKGERIIEHKNYAIAVLAITAGALLIALLTR